MKDYSYSLRIFSKLGHYPDKALEEENYKFCYLPCDDKFISVCKIQEEDKVYFESEISWALLSEIKL